MLTLYDEVHTFVRIGKHRDTYKSDTPGDMNYQSPDDWIEAQWDMAVSLDSIMAVEEHVDLYEHFENKEPKTIITIYNVGDIIVLSGFNEVVSLWKGYLEKVIKLNDDMSKGGVYLKA